MKLFNKIVNEVQLLNEITTNRDDDIKKAIDKVLRVRITYDDKKDVISKKKGKKERYILPVAYGLTKNGKRAIRAYQTSGSTKRGVPKWKLFLLDNIISWTNGKKSFKNFGDTLIKLGLNTKGDKHMTNLFAITPIGNQNVSILKNSNPIDSEPVTKNDVNPTTQNQLPSTTKKSDDFTKNSKKQDISIDNNQNNDYFSKRVEAPKTEPITKTDVQPQQTTNEPNNQVQQTPDPVTKPITKTDVENANLDNDKNNQDNKLTSTYKDLMNRMDNLYDNNDEEK